jgi:enoyl-CoA hydratase
MSCACDLVLASDSARFCLPEMHERGLPPTLAMTALFDRVDRRALTYLVFASEAIGGDAARACGLASEIAPDSDLQKRAAALAAHICSQPADSIRAVKNYLSLAANSDPSGRAALGSTLYAMVAGSR